MLKAKDGEFFISDWLRNRNTVEFLGIWESVFNPTFNYGEFAIIKSKAGLNSYKISVKEWVEKTNAIGLKATTGRYGGTYASFARRPSETAQPDRHPSDANSHSNNTPFTSERSRKGEEGMSADLLHHAGDTRGEKWPIQGFTLRVHLLFCFPHCQLHDIVLSFQESVQSKYSRS